jgi:hypothetical protein
MNKFLCLVALFLFVSLSAYADIAFPQPTPQPTATPVVIEKNAGMSVVISTEVSAPTLYISRNLLRELVAGNDARTDVAGFNSAQTIIGGAFLSLAFVFGGVWLMSGKKTVSKPIAAAAAIAICAFAAAVAYANIAPPKRNSRIAQDIFSKKMIKEGIAESRIKVQVSADEYGNEVILAVPKTADKPNKSEE